MRQDHWKMRLMFWYAKHIVRVPFFVNFTPPASTDMVAIGFAWSREAAANMRGNDVLRERLNQAEKRAVAMSGTRRARRIVNRAAKKQAEKVLKK